MIAAVKIDRSNATTTIYKAKGGLLALNDYDDNQDVNTCLKEDCDFEIEITLTTMSSSNVKEMKMETTYRGKNVRNEQRIFRFVFFVEGSSPLTFIPPQSVTIYQ